MCRSRRELSNAYLLAKIGVDTAENEPCKVCPLSVYRSPRYIQNAIDETNKSPACPSNASRIGKFVILPRDFSVETEELTPTLKLKRSTACKNFSEQIEAMYA